MGLNQRNQRRLLASYLQRWALPGFIIIVASLLALCGDWGRELLRFDRERAFRPPGFISLAIERGWSATCLVPGWRVSTHRAMARCYVDLHSRHGYRFLALAAPTSMVCGAIGVAAWIPVCRNCRRLSQAQGRNGGTWRHSCRETHLRGTGWAITGLRANVRWCRDHGSTPLRRYQWIHDEYNHEH